ncbi:hypothetical protein GGQ74_001171 [Desulfobaculum xiamenense]|uniref:Uncharacterized protein n=1 Tax=Desulfobaculum xiamenense TaxID=995050 RepID=A0A846QH29_9BACT|nr:hypothetical protein [Desulfobaculum xiamenense]NJB67531.1 hypothetical protein [Desulfobaculum xiamenense]
MIIVDPTHTITGRLCPKCLELIGRCERLHKAPDGTLECRVAGCGFRATPEERDEQMRALIYESCLRTGCPCPDAMRPSWARSDNALKEATS